jgi:hypothetical protein
MRVVAQPAVSHIRLQGLKTFDFPLTSAYAKPDDKYIIQNITGLGPPQVQVVIVDGKYQTRTPANRQLVMTIKLNPDWGAGETPKLLREELYKLLSTGYKPRVVITPLFGEVSISLLGLRVFAQPFSTVGYVSNWDQDMFAKDNAVVVTFDCEGPTWISNSKTTISAGTLSESKPAIFNPGTVGVGFKFSVKFTADRSNWFLRTTENQSIGLEFTKSFHSGDVLSVCTIENQQYVQWNKHRGKVQNMMSILKASSEFDLTLHPGMNHYVVPKTGWQWNKAVEFTPEYWGL